MIEKVGEKQVIEYFSYSVKPIYSELLQDIVLQRPEDIVAFCTKWFREKQKEDKGQNSDEEDLEEERIQILPDQMFKQLRKTKLAKARPKRTGLSSQCHGSYGKRLSIKISKGFQKDQNVKMNILFFCMNSFLFKNFTEGEINTLITMMGKKCTIANQIIFEEGELGDLIYFVYDGIFECYKNQSEGTKNLRFYHKGDTFGQICLLHVIKRQASIISRSEGILYILDRESYIHYKKICITKRRALYLETLKKQTLFKSFHQQELQKFCDVLLQITYEQNEVIINEGDVGKRFYIILEGILVAYKGNQSNIIQCYKEGDSFGEIALIKQVPRQASIKALTRCRLVYMTQQVFKRIFENINLDKQLEQKYFQSENSGFINLKRR